jgi:hypothetical protein
MVNKRRYVLRLWATPGGLLLSALAQMFLALWEEVRKLTLASRLLINTTPPSDVGKLKIKKIPGVYQFLLKYFFFLKSICAATFVYPFNKIVNFSLYIVFALLTIVYNLILSLSGLILLACNNLS